MSLLSATAALLSGLDAVITTTQPDPTDGLTFAAPDASGQVRMVPTVYLYLGAAVPIRGGLTTTERAVYAACYGATDAAADALAQQVRAALWRQQADNRVYAAQPSIAQPTEDRGYNPPEIYSLVRAPSLGLWGNY